MGSSKKVRILAIAIVALLSVLTMELLLRTLGFSPHQPIITHIKAKPSHALIPHEKYGLALQPGNFKVSLNEKLKYKASHLPDGSRACFPLADSTKGKINF